MKNTIKTLALATVIAFITFSFTTVNTDKKEINTEKSKVIWKGYKVTGSHEGTITIKSGSLHFNGEVLTGGEFVMDMTSINTTDISGNMKDKLDAHLKNDDFFSVNAHPTASLVFKDVKASGKNAYTIIGDLTIKGKTNPITFSISIYGNKATTSLKIDRTKYGIEYKSASIFESLKDKAIYDEFDLVADLEF
ncbi:lipid-binding protein [Pseudalgibacter alginicilyticus]|uniref:Lipid-binding protein n=1 Tax=Pseudalgibacter alginicilyticus TaxID=1736674 RepID=A0A0P0D532_9FLAO|nr:YceI family protein [Pseudalgibacter alginicilyticus]ALJ03669.1 lipid-binding protein [Pseudalgibacter alginicilyticus]